jgi:methyl-accepting chemotaxis protein
MLKNMKLGAKISFGFAMVICLAAVLGTLGVVSMNAVRGQSNILASEYMPEVQLVTDVERDALLTMYAVRGYALSEEQKYYDEGVKQLAEVNKNLADGRSGKESGQRIRCPAGADGSSDRQAGREPGDGEYGCGGLP